MAGAEEPELFEGSCQCGACRYAVRGRVLTFFVCHCGLCKRQSSSAFAMALWIGDCRIETLEGDMGAWRRETGSGDVIEGRFCRDCGSRLLHSYPERPDLLSIKPGSLTNSPDLRPVAHIWTSRAEPWISIPEDVKQYPENPPGIGQLMQDWRERRDQVGAAP